MALRGEIRAVDTDLGIPCRDVTVETEEMDETLGKIQRGQGQVLGKLFNGSLLEHIIRESRTENLEQPAQLCHLLRQAS